MKYRFAPVFWGGAVMAAALALSLYLAALEKLFFETNRITSPDISLGPVTAYFFGVVVVMALVLFFIPFRWLQYVFKALFTLMFAWGVFIAAALVLPAYASYVLAAAAGIVWLLWARIWLHDLLLLIALAGAGSVFGFLFSPWTFMIFTLIIAVYDVLAVRFGFMVWMADKLSESTTLPAFIFPRRMRDWTMSLKAVRVNEIKDKTTAEREYAILGGGDIGFPLMLCVAVFFEAGIYAALLVGAFALGGLVLAFLIQQWWLKGKPMPALPPIAFMSLAGFLISLAWLR